MPTREAGRLLEMAQRYRGALESGNADAADRITRGWVTAQQRLDVEVQSLMSKMEAARLAGVDPSPAWLYQQKRLTSLTDAIQVEVQKWAPMAEETTREAAYAASRAAQGQAQGLAKEAARSGVEALEATFTGLNAENMATILGHLAPGGPLRDLLVRLGGETAQAAQDVLLQGVILGKGSGWMTGQLRRAMDLPRWRAETIARTEALRAYRETTLATFQQTSVVTGWMWTAALDRRTCPACLALHGEEFTKEERLDGHPRCRCAMVPITGRPLDVTKGEDWLRAQSPLTQRSILGPRKYDLWKEGKLELGDMVARTHSPEWGTMRRERSVLEIVQGRNGNFRDVDLPTVDVTPQVLDDFPTDLPRSRFSQATLRDFHQKLKAMDDDTLAAQLGHKEAAVRAMAKHELDKREALAHPERAWSVGELERALKTSTDPGRQAAYQAELERRGLRTQNAWTDTLPRLDGPTVTQRSDLTLEAVGGDTARYLEGVPGIRRDGVTFHITDHDAAVRALERAAQVYRQTAATSPMDALRLRRVEGYLDEVRRAKGGVTLEEFQATNPRWRESRQYQVNCTNSVTAHELRRRGYDVTAAPRPTLSGRYRHNYYTDWGGDRESWSREWTVLQAKRAMTKEWPVGARGFVSVTWKGRRAGAHVFSVEKMPDGSLRFYDPQSGHDYGDGSTVFGDARPKITFLRVDDKPLTDKLEDYILRPGEDYGDKRR